VKTSAGVVIVGAGIVGCGVADHLTRLSRQDVVVLDQGPLFEAGGSTSHAPGLLFQMNPSKTMSDFAGYTIRRFSKLELDDRPCFYPVGGLEVAATRERWKDLKRKQGLAASWGIEAALLSPEECAGKSPLLEPGRIYGGFFVPSDGIAKAVQACEALACEARSRGTRFYGETEVTGIEVKNGRVRAVETSRGRIETETVVSCAGMWGPRLGRMLSMRIPLTPMQHQYVWTTPLVELRGETREVAHPILRYQDRSMYFRHRRDHYGVGSYQHRPMPVSPDEILRYREADVFPSVMQFTPEDFEPAWRDAQDLLPALRSAEIREAMNGLFSFTPDGMPLIGESREARGFWALKKAEVTGPGALELLQKLTTNQLDKPVGSVTYTLMLDDAGGIRSDITVARLGEEHFQVGLNGPRDIEWMERHLPEEGSVRVRDITAGTCCVGVWGRTLGSWCRA
jgi:dimethylglycine oxidase